MKKYRQQQTKKKKPEPPSSFTVKSKDTLLSLLISNLPQKTRKLLKAVLKDKQVSVDGKAITQFDHTVTPGKTVEVQWQREIRDKELSKLDIVHIDEDIIVVDKPAGLLTIATDKEKRKSAYSILSNFVKKENPDNKIFIIHRIDRETSGLLMFARSEKVKQKIQTTWNDTIGQRTYVAAVEGEVTPAEGTISNYLTESKAFTVYSSRSEKHGRKAVTHYKKIKSNNDFSLLHLNLETGRKHQIRVHMQDIGHPIVGDKKYGSTVTSLGRMCLHAMVLAFTHPTTGEELRFETKVPGKFMRLFMQEKV